MNTEEISARSTASRAAWTLGLQWGRLALQLGATLILARFIAPKSFGILGIALPVVAFAEVLRDFGVGTTILQSNDLSDADLTAFFWKISTRTGLLSLGMLVLAVPLGHLYSSADATQALRILAPVVFINGLSAVPYALLGRSMRVQATGFIELLSTASGLLSALGLVAVGRPTLALLGQQVVIAAVRLTCVCIVTNWRPSRPTRRTSRKSATTSRNFLIFNLLNYVGRNADNFIVGKIFGATALGYYTQAYTLLLLPLQQINAPLLRVIVPTLSRLRSDRLRYERYFLGVLRVTAYASAPTFILGSTLARPGIPLILGHQWVETGRLFAILGLAGVAQSIGYSATWLWTSSDRSGFQAVWAAITRPLIVSSFVIGQHWGLVGLVWAYTAFSLVEGFSALFAALHTCEMNVSKALVVLRRPMLLSVGIGLSSLAGQRFASSDLSKLSLGVAAAGAFTLLSWMLIPNFKADILALKSAIKGGQSTEPQQFVAA